MRSGRSPLSASTGERGEVSNSLAGARFRHSVILNLAVGGRASLPRSNRREEALTSYTPAHAMNTVEHPLTLHDFEP